MRRKRKEKEGRRGNERKEAKKKQKECPFVVAYFSQQSWPSLDGNKAKKKEQKKKTRKKQKERRKKTNVLGLAEPEPAAGLPRGLTTLFLGLTAVVPCSKADAMPFVRVLLILEAASF